MIAQLLTVLMFAFFIEYSEEAEKPGSATKPGAKVLTQADGFDPAKDYV